MAGTEQAANQRRLLDDDPRQTRDTEKLKADGVFLIDLATVPVNTNAPAERAAVLRRNIVATVTLAKELQPDGVVLVKQNVFELLQGPLRRAGLPLLHDEFIPFPGSGQQRRFRERFGFALETAFRH